MARPLRIEYDGALYHVTSRGNARKPIYKDDDDRLAFLDILSKTARRFNWLCHAYCLMNNHYHLVIETPDGNLSKGMRQINGIYTQYFNNRHNRPGHIFQGRYKAILIQKESHLLEVSRYVVLNPVRARAVGKPEEWRWSSYRGTVGREKPHPCLTTDWILGQFASQRRKAQEKYKEFVEAGLSRDRLMEKVKAQSILGDDDFVEKLIGYVRGYQDIREIPRSQRYIKRPKLDELFDMKARSNKEKRNKRINEAIEAYGYSQRSVADHLGLHYSTISRLINEGRA